MGNPADRVPTSTPLWRHHSARSPTGVRRIRAFATASGPPDRIIEPSGATMGVSRRSSSTRRCPWSRASGGPPRRASFRSSTHGWDWSIRSCVNSLRQFDPGPPPAIDSDLYVKEFEEVRDYGAKTGSLRSPEQTETALFFSDIPIVPIQAALRDLVTRRRTRHQRQRPALRRGRHEPGRCGRHGLEWQSCSTRGGARSPPSSSPTMTAIPTRGRSRLGAAHHDAALPGLAERTERRDRCREHRPCPA